MTNTHASGLRYESVENAPMRAMRNQDDKARAGAHQVHFKLRQFQPNVDHHAGSTPYHCLPHHHRLVQDLIFQELVCCRCVGIFSLIPEGYG
jgi:hypothetical protein